MFFVFGRVLLWWGALGDLVVRVALAGGGSYVLEGCSSVLGPAVGHEPSSPPKEGTFLQALLNSLAGTGHPAWRIHLPTYAL